MNNLTNKIKIALASLEYYDTLTDIWPSYCIDENNHQNREEYFALKRAYDIITEVLRSITLELVELENLGFNAGGNKDENK